MNKIFKTILIASIVLFSAGVLFIQTAQASGLVVEAWDEVLSQYLPLGDKSLFDESNFLPGESVTRLVKVTNKNVNAEQIIAEAIEYPGFPNTDNIPVDDLSRVLLIVIRDYAGGDLYGGTAGEKTLFDFYEAGEIHFSDITANNFKEYEFEISFPSGIENEWEEKTTAFDMLIYFKGTEGGGEDDGDDGDGGGGGSVVWPPGLLITNEASKIIIEDCSVVISWNTSYGATSQVIYGSGDQENHLLKLSDNIDTPPLYGYAYTSDEDSSKVLYHEVPLYNLTPNTTYYYRCISHASPATIGYEYSFNCGSCGEKGEVAGTSTEVQITEPIWQGIGTVEPIIEEIIKEVAGAEEVIEEEIEEFKSNLLASIGSFVGGFSCLPWWLILILSAFCLIKAAIIHKRREKQDILLSRINAKKEAVWFIWSSIFTILAFCFYFTSHYCIDIRILLVLVLLIFLTWYFLSKMKQNQIS